MSEAQPKYPLNEALEKHISESFTYHAPFGDQAERYGVIRGAAKNLALLIASNVPPCSEQGIALAKLRECVMFANAGIACCEKPLAESETISA
jgi:hypothetical protein